MAGRAGRNLLYSGRAVDDRKPRRVAITKLNFRYSPAFHRLERVPASSATIGSLQSRLERRRTVSQKKIVQPMIDELKEKQKPKETGGASEKPLEPSELDQDSGGGYNPDGTYPQT